jgi:multidrug efflux system outer membrane protein
MKTSIHFQMCLGLALLTSACQVGPDSRVEIQDIVDAPEAWSKRSDGQAVGEKWWKDFGDPQLSSLIEEALGASPSLASAGARVNAALASLQAIAGLDEPQLNAGLNLSRRRQNFIGLPIPGSGVASSTSNNFGLSLNASWELDLWGRLAAGERAVAASLKASMADLSGAQLALTSAVARSYFSLVESKLAVELAEAQVKNAMDALEQSGRLQAHGLGSAQAVLSNRVALNHARADAIGQRQRVIQLEPTLASLIGRSSGPVEVDTTRFVEQPLPPTPDAGLPAELLGRRADLAAMSARLDGALAQTQMAHAARYPSISLSASAGTSSDDLSNLLDGDFGVWNLGANILAPLLTGGRLRSQEDEAAANQNGALFSFAAQVLVAFSEVESALNNEGLLRQRQTQIEELLANSAALEESARRLHRSGTGNAAMVYSARSNQLNARSSLLALRALAYSNRISLIAALGGGFNRETETETADPNSPQLSTGEKAL